MLANFSVKKPYTVVVAVILVLILGAISFINLQTDLLPSFDLPYVLVMTSYPGASPEEVELVVTKPLEQVMATVSNIKQINSVSSENSSIIIMEFNNDTNMDSATIEINGLLDLVKSAWPDGITSPMLLRLNPDMLPIMVASVDIAGMDMIEISHKVQDDIIPRLESIPGLASVSATGLLEERIELLLEDEKISALNKKLLRKVDSELADAEDKLDQAQVEIKDGLAKLESEQKKQTDQLVQGEKALKQGKEQLDQARTALLAGETELLAAEAELRDKRIELVVQENNLTLLLGVLEELEKSLLAAKDSLFAPQDEIRQALQALLANLPDEVKAGLGQEIQAMELRLQEAEELAGQEIQQMIASLRTELDQVLAMLAGGKNEIDKGLELIKEKKQELLSGKQLLDQQISELGQKEQELSAGKALLDLEMGRAREKLSEGEMTLAEKMAEFEKARDEALKKASLDGVITKEMVSGLLAAQNFSMPAGSLSDQGNELLVKVGDRLEDRHELEELLLFDTGEAAIGKIYLKDIATVTVKDNSTETYARVNGNAAVILNFQKQSTFSTAEVTAAIREKARELELDDEGLSITALMDQGMYIDIVVDSVLKNVIYGGLLAILILLIFLKDIRPTFIIAVSIPISLIFAIAMMFFTGVSINIISLAGLALGVGMLVDNSIVVIENIYRLRLEGMPTKKASVEGAREIAGAIISSTLTTASVFLPIVFVKGISRQIFTDMGLTIAYSLLASLIVALTLVPMLASNMLEKSTEKKSRLFKGFTKGYTRLLGWSLRHRAVVLLLVVALAGLSVVLSLSLGTAFIPDMDAPQMSLSIRLDKEAARDDLLEATETVIERLMGIEGIETIGAFEGGAMAGMGFMGGGGGRQSSMSLYILLDEDQRIKNKEMERAIMAATEDLAAEISVNSSNMDMSALAGSGIDLMVKGDDLDQLQEIARDLGGMLAEVEGAVDVTFGQEETLTEMRIVVDKEKAMAKGLTVAQVYAKVSSTIAKGRAATTLTLANKDFPVIVLDDKTQDLKKNDLRNIELSGKSADEEIKVRLGDIATISEGSGLASIRRDKQQRYLSVTAAIDTEHNIGLVSREFARVLKDYELPQGYRVEIAGENQVIDDSLEDLVYMLLIAVAFIYLIMVAQFQSLLSPFIVMFTIPLAFTGGLMALFIMGYEVSVISMLGFLVLSGVVVNNGIVFVDFTNQLRQSGLGKKEALLKAGSTRLRPILMTAVTTILGLSTLSMGVGLGSEMLQPLAVVSIGGLVYSTLLTLVVIPVIYDLLHKDKPGKAAGKELV